MPRASGLVTSVNGELTEPSTATLAIASNRPRLVRSSAEIAPLLAEREILTNRNDMLLAMLAAGELDRHGFNAAVGNVQAAMAANEREIAQVTAKRLNIRLTASQSVADAWEANDDVWWRAVVAMLIERIEVQPSARKPFFEMPDGTNARFDAEAVTIIWRV